MDDFNVALRDQSGIYRSFKRTPGLQVVKTDPLRVSPGAARPADRQEHARSRGLPGEGEMTRATTLLVSCFVSAAVLAGAGQTGLDPAKLLKPGTDSWPSYNGDYSGRRYSPLAKINDGNITSLSLGWVYRLNTGIAPGGGGRRGDPQGHAADDQRRAVPHHAGSRVGGGRTHRPRDLAPHLAGEGRHHHRQPRRGRARRLAVLRVAGLQPRVAQYQGRDASAGTSRSATSISSTTGRSRR